MEKSERSSDSMTEEGRYRLLVEAITDYAVYMLDPDGIVTSWNPGAQRFKGYTSSEIIGQHFSRFYSEDDQRDGLPARALETAIREGRFENEGWRIRKDGTRFWAYVVIDPIRLPSGRLVGFAKITRDLTERKIAEEALRKSQEQFALLVQGVTDYAIYMLDPQGIVANWNLGAQRIKGYLPEEIIGRHFSKFYTDEDREAGEPAKALAAVAQNNRFEKEGWRVRKDGTRFFAHVIIDAIRDDHGEILGFAKVIRDITDRKQTEQKLEAARAALIHSQKLEAIGQLTGGVAHDFNNLLMAVLGSLELMRKRLPDDPKLKALLENAVQGAQRGSVLTQRMLAFARRQELKLEPVDIPELVRGMSDLLQRSLGPTVSIETRFPLLCHPVLGDANQLEMVLLNLAVNSRDAMPDGGQIVIAIRNEIIRSQDGARLKPGSYVCLTVSDDGQGMDEETLRRATEPFFTSKGVGKGTGLGLSMVTGIAEQCGGWFDLRSRLGKGTIAALWLPVAEIQRPAVEKLERAADASELDYVPLIVVAVDDDSLVLTNTVAMLDDLGHTALGASSGKQAIELIRQHEAVDLVITDYAMPDMNGLELVEAIKQEWPELPVLVATGFAEMGEGKGRFLPKLAKPFTQAELARELLPVIRATGRTGRVLNFRLGVKPTV